MQVADDRAHRHRQCPVCGGRRGERKGGWYLLDHLLRRQLLTGAVYKAAHPKNDRVCLHCYKRCTRPAHPTTFLAAESADHQCHVCHTQSAGSWHKLESFDVCDLCHAPRNCSWKDRQWVEECATRYGRGIRATRHIPAPSTASIVAEIHGCPLTELEYKALSDDEYAYVIDTSLVDGQARWFNLRQHWLGLLNHAPPSRCNVRFEGLAVVQVEGKSIAVHEELLADYGVDHWVHQLTGKDFQAMRCGKALKEAFEVMHQTTDDYTPLLEAFGPRRKMRHVDMLELLRQHVPVLRSAEHKKRKVD